MNYISKKVTFTLKKNSNSSFVKCDDFLKIGTVGILIFFNTI